MDLNPYRSAVFIYDEYLSKYFVLSLSEINMSCLLVFTSNKTFNLLVRRDVNFRKIRLFTFTKFS